MDLVISVPIYYLWRLDGIVPAIILTSVFSLIIAWYFASKIKIAKVSITLHETTLEGKGMLKMGFMLSLSSLITMSASYVVRIFISNTGGVKDVGLYSAGFAIISTYVGLIFTAMATDYYPRLSAVAHDNNQAKLLINQQAEVAILIVGPILTVFLIFINWVVLLLYSSKFTPVNGMIHWAAVGMYFKAACWSIGFILLAKSASNLFFWNELVANIYMLGMNIIGYKILGLDGLGISFAVGYLIYLLQVFFLARYKYRFSFNSEFIKIFGLQLILGFFVSHHKIRSQILGLCAGVPFICFSTWFSFKELDKRIGIKNVIVGFLKNNGYSNLKKIPFLKKKT